MYGVRSTGITQVPWQTWTFVLRFQFSISIGMRNLDLVVGLPPLLLGYQGTRISAWRVGLVVIVFSLPPDFDNHYCVTTARSTEYSEYLLSLPSNNSFYQFRVEAIRKIVDNVLVRWAFAGE